MPAFLTPCPCQWPLPSFRSIRCRNRVAPRAGEELALRQSVLDWLDVWSKRRVQKAFAEWRGAQMHPGWIHSKGGIECHRSKRGPTLGMTQGFTSPKLPIRALTQCTESQGKYSMCRGNCLSGQPGKVPFPFIWPGLLGHIAEQLTIADFLDCGNVAGPFFKVEPQNAKM